MSSLSDTLKAAEQGDAEAQTNLGLAYYNGEGVAKDFAEAVRWFRKAAEQGHAEAQLHLGMLYATGDGIPQDDKEAVRWWRQSAEQGFAQAQFNLGVAYATGKGVDTDSAEAVRWYRLAAEQGLADAQVNLGGAYYEGVGVLEDKEEAVRWFRQAAEQGDIFAQYNLGIASETGDSVAQNFAEAVRWYRQAAEQGHAAAQVNLGNAYHFGKSVEKDDAEANEWYRKAAEQGDADAQFNLGNAYHFGRSVEKDDAKANEWYRLAAEQGNASAQYSLGISYDKGEGVAKDHAEAVRWYRLAAEQGLAEAQYNLGVAYKHGEGVAKDHVEAVRWFRLAAEQGNASAQSNLGFAYKRGEGVAKDAAEGIRWYRLAAEQGYAIAQFNLGVSYYKGEGVAKDNAEAARWYRQAAEQGLVEAHDAHRDLEASDVAPSLEISLLSGEKEAIRTRQLAESVPQSVLFMRGGPESASRKEVTPRRAGGLMDLEEKAVRRLNAFVEAIREVYDSFGFAPLEVPMLERADVLGADLPDDDSPRKGVFEVSSDESLALRYDLTAPLARHVAENLQRLSLPYRTCRLGWVFRDEKPGAGRYRQFYQADADTISSPSPPPAADAEACLVMAACLRACGFPREGADVAIRVSNRKLVDALFDALGVGVGKTRLSAMRAMDKLDRLGLDAVRELLGGGRMDESGDFKGGAGLSSEAIDGIAAFLSLSGRSALDDVARLIGDSVAAREASEETKRCLELCSSESAIAFDPSVVRGLGYYTGIVFEGELRGDLPSLGSVGGGGRYDDLITRFLPNEKIPSTGTSLGVSRLVDADAALSGGSDSPRRGPVLVLNLDDVGEAMLMASELRSAGISAEAYLGDKGLRGQMKYADRRGCPLAVVSGSLEREKGVVQLKDLRLGKSLSSGVSDHETWRRERPGQREIRRENLVSEASVALRGDSDSDSDSYSEG